MYRGFNIVSVDINDDYIEAGKTQFKNQKQVIIKSLEKFVLIAEN
jgi:hypothetical protein